MATKRRAKARFKYRSKFEQRIAKELADVGMGFKYEARSFPIIVPVARAYCETCRGPVVKKSIYTPDFFLDNGIILETKGKFTASARMRMQCFKQQYPDLKFAMLFQRDNKISPNSKTRYTDWCLRVGIDADVHEVPDRWIKGKIK